MEEVWKGLIYKGEDYSKFYDVSNLGKVRNCRTFRVLRPSRQTIKDYWGVALSLGYCDNQKRIKIHIAVASTYVPNPNNLLEVNHTDGNRENNTEINLEWCTRSYNNKHAIDLGLNPKRTCYRFSEEIIKNMRRLYEKENISITKLAVRFNINYSSVSDIVRYRTYKDVL